MLLRRIMSYFGLPGKRASRKTPRRSPSPARKARLEKGSLGTRRVNHRISEGFLAARRRGGGSRNVRRGVSSQRRVVARGFPHGNPKLASGQPSDAERTRRCPTIIPSRFLLSKAASSCVGA